MEARAPAGVEQQAAARERAPAEVQARVEVEVQAEAPAQGEALVQEQAGAQQEARVRPVRVKAGAQQAEAPEAAARVAAAMQVKTEVDEGEAAGPRERPELRAMAEPATRAVATAHRRGTSYSST